MIVCKKQLDSANIPLPRKAVTNSGAELPAAMKVAPATSWERPRAVVMRREMRSKTNMDGCAQF